MNMKEECFKVFSENIGADRKHAIRLATDAFGIITTTAQTYYSAWRNELMNTPNAKRGDIPAKTVPIKVKMVPDVKPIIEKDEFKALGEEQIAAESKEIKWKVDEMKSVEVEEKLFEVTKLIPVKMEGQYGIYDFSKEGVTGPSNEEFISKDKMAESLEAFIIWERCYTEGVAQ